jgi:hypothetical protein
MKFKTVFATFSLSLACGAIGFGICWFLLKPSVESSIFKFASDNSTDSPTNQTETDDVELPWLVKIQKRVNNQTVFVCGGSLISMKHLLAGKNESLNTE